MIRIHLIANTDNEKDWSQGDLELDIIDFPERPKIRDVIYLEYFIDNMILTPKAKKFIEENSFIVAESAWSKDDDGVYLIVWCNPE